MKTKRRIEILDIAKCIAIFTVVWGHTYTNAELLGEPPTLARILYSTHMPLFFFLSGMSISTKAIKNTKEWRYFIRKDILTIAIPYVIWALIYSKFSYNNFAWIIYGSWQGLGYAETVTSLWFLATLFIAKIFVQLIVNILSYKNRNRFMYLIIGIIFVLGGYFLPRLEMGYPWCFDVALEAAGLMLMGISLKEEVIKLAVQKGEVLIGLLVGSTIIYGILIAIFKDKFGVVMMCKNSYPTPVLALVLAILGSIFIIVLSMLCKRLADEWIEKLDFSSLSYIGQHTLGILLLHKPFLQEIAMPVLKESLGVALPDFIIRILAALISMFVSLWVCKFIEYYIPELVGIFSKEKIMEKE